MSNAGNYLLGIDLGTTNVKAIITDSKGSVIASASRANSLVFPGPNMVEQDPALWWSNTVSILNEITNKAGKQVVSDICGISVSSQTVTLLPVNVQGEPLRNAIIWMDSRSTEELDELMNILGEKTFSNIIGATPNVSFLPCKLLWFKRHEPALYAQTYKVLQASSYLNYKLTGKMTIDMDQAMKSQCLDVSTLKWSDQIADALGINLFDILPKPSKETDIIGTVTEAAATETGLKAGIPVIAGTSDATASMYATGISKVGEAGESSGTTSLVFLAADHPNTRNRLFMSTPSPFKETPYIFGAPINTSGASLKWYLDKLGKEERDYAKEHNINVYDHLNYMASHAPAGSNGLLFFPYLLGERAPLWNSYSRGMFIGLSLNTAREDIVRSVFEGTAFALKHVFQTYKEAGGIVNSMSVTGGGSKSRTWGLIKASMLRVPVSLLDEACGDVPMGDCLLAGLSVGLFKDLSSAMKEVIHVKEVLYPVDEWADTYDRLFPYYLKMYQHLDQDLKELQTDLAKIQS